MYLFQCTLKCVPKWFMLWSLSTNVNAQWKARFNGLTSTGAWPRSKCQNVSTASVVKVLICHHTYFMSLYYRVSSLNDKTVTKSKYINNNFDLIQNTLWTWVYHLIWNGPFYSPGRNACAFNLSVTSISALSIVLEHEIFGSCIWFSYTRCNDGSCLFSFNLTLTLSIHCF